MKKSSMFLLAALTVPAATALVGVAAGVDTMKVDPKHSADTAHPPGHEDESLPLQTVMDQTVQVDQSLDVDLANAKLTLSFDPSLVSEARIKAESRSPESTNANLTKTSLSFQSKKEGSPVHVDLALPASLAKLALTAAFTECNVRSDAQIVVKDLVLKVDGGDCDFDLSHLEASKIHMALNGGKLDMKLGAVATGGISLETNAGKLDWTADSLTYDPVGEHRFTVQNNAGKTDVRIKKTVPHSIDASLQVGKLDVNLPGEQFELKGMSEQRRIEGPANAPVFKFEVNAGKGELRVDELAPAKP